MISYNKTNDKYLIEHCILQEEFIDSSLYSQKLKRKILNQCLDKITLIIETIIDIDNVSILLELLENLKSSLDLSESNINKTVELKDKLINLIKILNTEKTINITDNTVFNNIYTDIIKFNEYYISIEKEIIENDDKIDKFLISFIEHCNFELPNATLQNSDISVNTLYNSVSSNTDFSSTNISDMELNKKLQEESSSNELTNDYEKDNKTLIISSIEGKVFLPYIIKDVKDILKKFPNDYDSIEDVIAKKYIVPLSRYKNPFLSRFRETFNLMRKIEKASITKSLDLALELSCNTLLNPAIISACRNLDELDIYLDYLNTNELDKFNLFTIKYELPPIKQK